jgi:hypothetical protein
MRRRSTPVPVAPDNTRKIITLPKVLAARIRAFRFARQLDTESQAYVELLALGLEAAERKKRAARSRSKPEG